MEPLNTVLDELVRDFNHPYTPYPIQVELMTAIYDTIENGFKVGIFESPTGTGKTLSIICSTMTWLRNHKREQTMGDEDSDDEPEWVKEAHRKAMWARRLTIAERYEQHLLEVSASTKVKVHSLEPGRKRSKAAAAEEFVPDDYYSDDDAQPTLQARLKQEIAELALQVDGRKDLPETEASESDVNILFSSRTHSQLNQFATQLRETTFPASFEGLAERVKFLPLASRKQLCINPRILRYGETAAINDACVDLQKADRHGCSYLPKPLNPAAAGLVKQFTDMNFAEIRDIEDLGEIGRSLHVCPYYSVRSGVPLTEIVALPYQLLLQQSTREAVGVSLRNAIVVIDEAHNLLDAIAAMHSVTLKLSELVRVADLLKLYMQKFSSRLNGGNRVNLTKLIKMVLILKRFMEAKGRAEPGTEIPVYDIFHGTSGDLLNLHKLEKYIATSKIAYKIESYLESLATDTATLTGMDKRPAASPLLFKVIGFMKCLTNPSREGKYFWDEGLTEGKVDPSLNYMLLDPSEVFREVIEQARCVLLCGGTMEPVSDYTDNLFPYLEPTQIKRFSCGHVIPPENLNVYTVTAGPRGGSFEFSYTQREDAGMIEEMGLALLTLARTVPDGMVVFFPSYKYLSRVVETEWKGLFWTALNKVKPVFQETSGGDILGAYSASIACGKGGILLSVVGGKLSEGINFSDGLARAVVMVGLPYPNAFSGELVVRRKHVQDQTILRGGLPLDAAEAARTFYENICMRLVNQCIGRSIRHSRDFSTIYLFDARFKGGRIAAKLSGWVSARMQTESSFHAIVKSTQRFFAVNRQIE